MYFAINSVGCTLKIMKYFPYQSSCDLLHQINTFVHKVKIVTINKALHGLMMTNELWLRARWKMSNGIEQINLESTNAQGWEHQIQNAVGTCDNISLQI